MTSDMYFLVFAPKFWHMYMIMYSNFMVIVKPCHKALKFQEKSKKNAFSSNLHTDLHFIYFPFLVCNRLYHMVRATPYVRSHWTKKEIVQKLNLGGNMAVDKSAWIKAWKSIHYSVFRVVFNPNCRIETFLKTVMNCYVS